MDYVEIIKEKIEKGGYNKYSDLQKDLQKLAAEKNIDGDVLLAVCETANDWLGWNLDNAFEFILDFIDDYLTRLKGKK